MKRLVPDPGSAPGPQLLESCVLSTHTPTGNFTRGSLDSPHVKELLCRGLTPTVGTKFMLKTL